MWVTCGFTLHKLVHFTSTTTQAQFHCALCVVIVNLSIPRVYYKEMSYSFNFESINKILWYDHSNASSAVLLHGTISFSIFTIFSKMKFEALLDFLIFGTLRSQRIKQNFYTHRVREWAPSIWLAKKSSFIFWIHFQMFLFLL